MERLNFSCQSQGEHFFLPSVLGSFFLCLTTYTHTHTLYETLIIQMGNVLHSSRNVIGDVVMKCHYKLLRFRFTLARVDYSINQHFLSPGRQCRPPFCYIIKCAKYLNQTWKVTEFPALTPKLRNRSFSVSRIIQYSSPSLRHNGRKKTERSDSQLVYAWVF